MNKFDRVYEQVSKIPKGKVTTYGALSRLTDLNPRVVGYALHANKDPKNVPCHRVINSFGKLSKGYAFGGVKNQKEILIKEGIKFDKKDTVNLEIYGYFI